MMLHNRQKSHFGFTLIELAIVLAVVGLMTVGLWRLLSSSNQQSKDTATAGQQLQLINAAKSFLASNDGTAFFESFCSPNCASGLTVSLPLPSAGTPAGGTTCYSPIAGDTNLNVAPFNTGTLARTWCTTLPKGFSGPTAGVGGTTNPYGQTYSIRVVYGTTATIGTAGPPVVPAAPPSAYSIMIMTNGGDTIADTSGGRISSQIGSDGGFIYSTIVCNGSASMACGAYGAWFADPVGTYGFGSAPTGHVASQTYWAAESNSTGPWLARQFIDTTYNYNTLAGTNIWLSGNAIYSGTYNGTTTPTADASTIYLNNLGVGPSPLTVKTVGTTGGVANNPAINIITGCTRSTPALTDPCGWGLQISGDATITGMLNANVAFTSSDVRLKTNIRPLSNTLDNIMQLKPVAFTYKSNGLQSFGVIAQDLVKVYPELVSQGNEETMKSVNYEGLIAPLIGAVQELKRENDDLHQRLTAEEKRQKALEQKIDR
jgi:prepilin-type N-terminal cleavage/methylation domain-containing protein